MYGITEGACVERIRAKTEGWEISQTEEEEAEGEESRGKEQTSRQKDKSGLKSQKYLLDKCI